jgi:PKD repeat protein
MRKNIYLSIVLIIISINFLSAEWNDFSNYKQLKQSPGKILDYRLTQDAKFIYIFTGEFKIIKIDNTSGNVVNEKQINKDFQCFFFSEDAKSYITVKVDSTITSIYNLEYLKYDYVQSIFDISADTLIGVKNMTRDSIIANIAFNPGWGSYEKIRNISIANCNYLFDKNYLISTIRTYVVGVNGGWDTYRNGGFVSLCYAENKQLLQYDCMPNTILINKFIKDSSFYFIAGGSYGQHHNSEYYYTAGSGLFIYNRENKKRLTVFQTGYSASYDDGVSKKSGSLLLMEDLAISGKSNIAYLKSGTKLFYCSMDSKKIIDSSYVSKEFYNTVMSSSHEYIIMLSDNRLSFFSPTLKIIENKIDNHNNAILKSFQYDKSNEMIVINVGDTNIRLVNCNQIIQKVGFNASKKIALVGEYINMTLFTELDIKEIAWDFSDGMIINKNEPVKKFLKAGIYSVKLTVTDKDGKIYYIEKKDYLDIRDTVKAIFTTPQSEGTSPMEVVFKNLSTGAVNDIKWNFGDSTKSTEFAPIHIYDSTGHYHVKLFVSDGYYKDSIIKYFAVNVNVKIPEFVNIINQNSYKFYIGTIDPMYDPLGWASISMNLSEIKCDKDDNIYLGIIGRISSGSSYNNFYYSKFDKDLTNKYFRGLYSYYKLMPFNSLLLSDNLIISLDFSFHRANFDDFTFVKKDTPFIFTSKSVLWNNEIVIAADNKLLFYDNNLKIKDTISLEYQCINLLVFQNKLILISSSNSSLVLTIFNDLKEIQSTYPTNIKNIKINKFCYDKYGNIYFIKYENNKHSIIKYNISTNTFISKDLSAYKSINDIILTDDGIVLLAEFKVYTGYVYLDYNLDIHNEVVTYGPHKPYIIGTINSKGNLIAASCSNVSSSYDKIDYNLLTLEEIILPKINSVEETENVNNNNHEFLIFPNPATEYIEINFDAINPMLKQGVEDVADIKIFDMLGINVSPAGGRIKEGGRIDISNLSPGIYFIKIGNRVEKFVKM